MPSISQFRRTAIVVGALVAGFTVPSGGAHAADPDNPTAKAAFCESYAHLTLRDVNHSVENRCAKTGAEWSPSFDYHYHWCMQEPDLDAVRRALSTRNFEAMHCEEGAKGATATSDTGFPPIVADEQPGTNFPPVVDDATPSGAPSPVVEDKAAPAPTPESPPVAAAKGSTGTDKKSDATEAAESSSSEKHRRHATEDEHGKHLHGDHQLREKLRRAARHIGGRLLRSLADR
jgi:hypothetical protein